MRSFFEKRKKADKQLLHLPVKHHMPYICATSRPLDVWMPPPIAGMSAVHKDHRTQTLPWPGAIRVTAYVQGQGEGEIEARLLLDAGVAVVLVVGHQQRFLRLPSSDPALAPAVQKPWRQQRLRGERQKAAHGSGRSGIVLPNQPSPPSPSCQLVP